MLSGAGIATAIYFGLAAYSIHSFVDITPTGKLVFRTYPPFQRLSGAEYLLVAQAKPTKYFIEKLDSLADSLDDNNQSPVLLYEGPRLLGPAHSLHAEIAELGHGRYSHWRGQGIRFSASDNTDPNTNRRPYWAVIP
jgi:hypothetical protein